LSACGGGGDSDSTGASGKTSAGTSVAQTGGTYILPCTGTIFTPSSDPDARNSESKTATIVISRPCKSLKALQRQGVKRKFTHPDL